MSQQYCDSLLLATLSPVPYMAVKQLIDIHEHARSTLRPNAVPSWMTTGTLLCTPDIPAVECAHTPR